MYSASNNQPTMRFEFPLNERFRSFLRIENLHQRWHRYLKSDHPDDNHTALLALLDLYDFTFRNDIKGDLLAELSRYKQSLNQYFGTPEISEEKLTQIILRLTDAQKQIEQSPKFGGNLVDNEWLINIKSRLVVSSGICSFDMGFYYQWLQNSVMRRRNDLETWVLPFNALFDAVNLLLEIARNMAFTKDCNTLNQVYQQPLFSRKFDILQIGLATNTPFLPDISANKHVIWLRFALPVVGARATTISPPSIHKEEIEFHLGLCGAPGSNGWREDSRLYGTLG